MNRYRVEYLSAGAAPAKRQRICVPDVRTALIVADINTPHGGSAELWDGDRQLARLERQAGNQSPYWRVG